MIGEAFGRWRVLARLENRKKLRVYLCLCECGNRSEVLGTNLRRGRSKQCVECGIKTLSASPTTHGMTYSAENVIWRGMKRRCFAPKCSAYKYYGGRGITVCEHWLEFANFFADMGPRPSSNHSIERIDNNGNYEPGNVRWATRDEQAKNKRSLLSFEVNGVVCNTSEAAALLNVTPGALRQRAYRKRVKQ